MDGSGLFHRELIAVQMLVQGAADIVLAAVEDGLQNAGMGPADGFVLVGLQAELAQPLDVLEGGQHVVEVRLHAAQLERAAVEGVVKFQHPGLAVLGAGVALQHTVLLNEQAVSPLLLAGQPPADVVQDLLSSV